MHGVDHKDKGARTLEVYVPLRFSAGGEPVGVYEVYLSYTAIETEIAADTRTMYGVIAGGLLLLWAALYRIVLLASRRLRRQATHDALTGLPNRVLLEERLERALATAERSDGEVAVLFIDLDRFKEINDTLGHSYGDELLRQVALRLARAWCATATRSPASAGTSSLCCCRPCATARTPRSSPTRLRDALHRSFSAADTTLDVEASIGVAMSPLHGTTPDELLASADIAMYSAKERKAGAVFFDPEDRVNTPTRLNILGDLRRALEAEDQLVAALPAEVRPRRRAPDRRRGAAALESPGAREHPAGRVHRTRGRHRHHPQAHRAGPARRARPGAALGGRGPRDPDRRQPLHALPARPVLPRPRRAAPRRARRAAFAAALGDHRERGDGRPRPRDRRRCSACTTSASSLSIDDFGTGYTSMAYLRRLPVDELKVDRSFVMSMTENEHDAVLVRTAIDLGHNLGLTVVAEGVEQADHVVALRALDCDVVQGYHYARPMPAADVSALFARAAQRA